MQPQVADCPIAKPGRGEALPAFVRLDAAGEPQNCRDPTGAAEFAGVDPAVRSPLDVGELIALVLESEAS
jgi:hypothetical protein